MAAMKRNMVLASGVGLILAAQGLRESALNLEMASKGIPKWKKQLCLAMSALEGYSTAKCKAYINTMETDRCPESAADTAFKGSNAAAARFAASQDKECLKYKKEKAKILEEIQAAKEAKEQAPTAGEGKAPIALWDEDYQAGKWHKAFCKMRKVKKGESCDELIAGEKGHCEEVALNTRSKSGPNTWSMQQDKRCNKFRNDVAFVITVIKRPPATKKIKASAKACKPALAEVCKTALCPTFKAIEKKATGDCEDICASSLKDMWDAVELTEKELKKRFEDNDGSEALKALLREHAAKCMCVTTRQDIDDSVCYEGSMALRQGEKWCEFDRTASWQAMLQKEPDVTPFTPECQAVAVTFNSEDGGDDVEDVEDVNMPEEDMEVEDVNMPEEDMEDAEDK
eukprot:TRINITY_DN1331_c0_g2_i3.p1 TRINITY_DN1331_c0_g2~~TRINITY_DN1331_c0_g2_i3.p1  ORF type:complete len:431 (-),score=139.43 TRINITY_DN1331_c0_g2_i3:144-1340(-)